MASLATASGFSSSPAAALPASATSDASIQSTLEKTASERLRTLFATSDENSLNRAPLTALVRGNSRNADEFGDYITDAFFATERAAAEEELRTLLSIDRNALPYEAQIAYDVFKWQHEKELRGLQPDILAATAVRSIDQLEGLHMLMPDISSGSSVVQFKTLADYENNLKRLDDFTNYLDRAIVRMRQGIATGVVQPRVVMNTVAQQLDDIVKLSAEESAFYGPVKKFPDSISEADRARLKSDYAVFIRGKLLPAYTRLRDFVRIEYLPRTRTSIGISDIPGGVALYRYLIQSHTATDMSADQIHDIGLAEVRRISALMERVRDQVGFKGTLKQFATYMRTNPRFKPKSAEEIRNRYLLIQKHVDAHVGDLFSVIPKTPLEVRPMPEHSSEATTNAFYGSGSEDGSRPATFFFNANDLPSRVTFDAETLFLHEGSPGHHFQTSLARENTKLPKFMRFGGNTAFNERWALYAESLGPELGLLTDPYQYYGRLTTEMFRAARLVVDTGIHAKGWTRDQALNYTLDHTAYSQAMLAGEIDRYIANPGQALAYKMGQLTMMRLRTKAERELSPKFDIKEFHAQILDTGSIPLPVLEAKLDRWIAQRAGR